MALLDFIKNRQSQQPSAAPQSQSETAKQMYTRESVQEKLNAPPAGNLRSDQQAAVATAKDLFRQGTQQASETRATMPATATEGATAPQPMVQKSMNQDKAAPDLSPTSAQQGTRSTEAPSVSSESAGKAQEQAKRTIARTTPSWER